MEGREAAKFRMDERGRLLDDKGRAVDLPRASVYSLSINQEKAAKKGLKNPSRYFNQSKLSDTSYTRDQFYDPNLPKPQKKAKTALSGFVFGDETKSAEAIRADIVPTVEWWDRPLVEGDCYCQELTNEHVARFKAEDVPGKFEAILRSAHINFNPAAITSEIDHPLPTYSSPINTTSHSVIMHLTEKEQRKLRRLKRAKRLLEIREKVKLGLIPPPPQKIKLNTMMKLLAKEVSVDPSKTEQEVMAKYNERLKEHEKRNEERKLTKAGRKEREMRRLRRDSARESRTAVFRVERLTHKKNLFKVMKNAEQLALVGVCIKLPQDMPAIVVAEGGRHALKLYKKLLLSRVKWELEEPSGSCQMVWEAEIKDPVFGRFTYKEVESELEAREVLAERGCAHYLDLVLSWKPPSDL